MNDIACDRRELRELLSGQTSALGGGRQRKQKRASRVSPHFQHPGGDRRPAAPPWIGVGCVRRQRQHAERRIGSLGVPHNRTKTPGIARQHVHDPHED